ncbi:MAG TPA: alpha/beta hydrolase [Novosphingobium sp.]|nr:alpha/beta hydrolase [Novosphingobium sp.]
MTRAKTQRTSSGTRRAGWRGLLALGGALCGMAAGQALAAPKTHAPAHAASQAPASLAGDEALRARYALPHSHFALIEGEPVHYVDEGRGPVILLVHGSFASLRQWDDWARVLSRQYRVIRYDQSPAGLSGPSPTGDYTLEHKLKVIDALMDRLGVARFTIVGTSSGGLPVGAYAAQRPQRVRAVVLSNIAAGPLKVDPSTFPPAVVAALEEDRKHPDHHVPEYWRQVMLMNMVDTARVTPGLAQQWTDMNNRILKVPGAMPAILAAARADGFDRAPADLARIKAPTLLLWSDQDHEVPLAKDGQLALAALTVKDKALVVVPQCGHMMPLDCPGRSLDLALPFLHRVAGGR